MSKKIYKSSQNKVFTGTCGGIGEYFNIDPTIIRLIFAATLLLGGTGIVVYIIAAVLIPSKPIDDFENMEQANKNYRPHNNTSSSKDSNDKDFDSYFEKN